MRGTVREGVEAGAVGLSTGLIYEPGRYAATEEIVALAREMGQLGGLYATHMRNEAAGLLDAVAEAIRIGEEGGSPSRSPITRPAAAPTGAACAIRFASSRRRALVVSTSPPTSTPT